MTPEVKAAMERYRKETESGDHDGCDSCGLPSQMLFDMETLADAFLAMADETAVNVEFFLSLGSKHEIYNGFPHYIIRHPEFGTNTIARHCQVAFCEGVVYVNGLGTTITTRGQLLRLLEALQIARGE